MPKSTEKKSSKLTYFHKVLQQSVKNDKASTYEENVVDGPRGLSIKYFSKSGDKVEKIAIYGKDDSFTMNVDGNKTEINREQMLKEIKSNPKLKFASDIHSSLKNTEKLYYYKVSVNFFFSF